MATKKISELTELTSPAGTEELIVNAGGTSKKIQIDNLPDTTLSSLGITATATELNYVDGVTSAIQTQLGTKLPLAGGALTGAVTTNSTFDGRDVATDGSKLDGIEASANNYTHPTGAGNLHLPTGGSVGQVLTNTASGTGTWQDAAGGGGGAMELISKQVASGVTSVEFIGISTSYKHLEIRVSSTNSTVGGAKIQFGSSGTYTSSGYRRFGTSSSYIHLITYTGSAAKDLNTIVHIGNLGESSNTLFSSESEGWETAYAYQTSNFGVLESSSSMDSIKIYHTSAFNGTFSLYGIKDS